VSTAAGGRTAAVSRRAPAGQRLLLLRRRLLGFSLVVSPFLALLGMGYLEESTAQRVRLGLVALLLGAVLVGWWVRFRSNVIREGKEEKVRSEEALRRAHERADKRLEALTRYTRDVVLVLDSSSRVQFVSPSCERVLDRPAHKIRGRRATTLLVREDVARLTEALATLQPGGTRTLELTVERGDGRPLATEATVVNSTDDCDVDGFLVTLQDVSQQHAYAEQLALHSLRDSVTGLANRRLFTDRLTHALAARGEEADPVVVLICDLDDFKAINDRHGHAVGDQVLSVVAQQLLTQLGPGDTAARLGGDEFAVLLEGCSAERAMQVAARIVRALAQPLSIGSSTVSGCASIGVAHGVPGQNSAEELLRNADVAMYWAKDRGRSTAALYEPAVHEQAIDKLVLRTDLQRAIRTGELRLVFQPTVHLGTGRIKGFEALCRWHHPRRGMIPPSDFIPMAEETGMVTALGSWVLLEACMIGAQLQGPDMTPTMAVNISPQQLAQPDFVVELLGVLDQSGLPADRLVLEITETAVLTDIDRVIPRLAALRTLGVRVAIDDFGTGYSSLSYLSRLPLDVLKIDKSFVDRVVADAQGASVTQAVLDMSNSLGLVTVGEGVEHPDQANWLRAAGCTLGQGYLWSRPVQREDAEAMLLAQAGRGGMMLDQELHPRRASSDAGAS